MAKRLFTADWHLGMEAILKLAKRGKGHGGPFSSVEEMDQAILSSAYAKSSPGDTIIHAGDLACFKADQDSKGLSMNPMQIVSQLPC